MNKVVLIGRLARDPEVRYSQNDTSMAIARFSLAVDRRRSANNQDGQSADFISCVAFGRTAEFIEKYFTKGRRIGVYGHIQTGSYTNKEGAKVYTTDVVVDEAEFVESRGDNTASDSGFTAPAQNQAAPAGDGFMNIPDGIDEDLPFN
ncbi:MAG: single-stranded DNA-binding protein [Lachnospiraceae bacterium]|nr:single-stranded DNA-binding protein [Lachnospiraceae bacterium]MBP5745575.1 single-stranded DNA-binding protein [Lachnospiraceae bacterium]